MKLQHQEDLKREREESNHRIESVVNSRMGREREEMAAEKKKLKQEAEEVRLQTESLGDEKLRLALAERDASHSQTEEELKLLLSEAQKYIKNLKLELEEQAKKQKRIPGERQGMAGENVLLEDLKLEFKTDEFVCKKNGVAMADIIQNIVTEKRERIETPIIYDKKTSSKVTKLDLDKAKNYKRIHNTEHCMIVTTDITETIPPRYTEMKDGILLVHPMVVVDVAKFIRNSIIETSRLETVKGCGNIAKDRIYEFLTSPEYNRDKQAKIEAKLKLDELHRSELKIWSKREECIRKWFEIDCKFDAFVSSVTQDEDKDGENPSI